MAVAVISKDHILDKVDSIGYWSGQTFIEDEKKTGRYLDFGWPLLNKAISGLEKGVFLIPAPANLGKSTVLLNIYSNIIVNNPDVFVVDFSLDDSREERFRNSIARLAKIPINWVTLPYDIPDAAKIARKAAAKQWHGDIMPQLQIIDETGVDNTARNFSTIRSLVEAYREKLPSTLKLVVVIDGFHNIIVDEMPYADDVKQGKYLSTEMKNLAFSTNTVILASAQTPKGSLRRGLTQDSVKGNGAATYDAKVIAPIFSDFAVNRGAAEVYHDAVLPHSGLSTPVRLPVIELDFAKNKAGSFKDIIFYRFYPEYAYVEEAPDQWQTSWKKVVYGS